jgi:hypothetical protein
MFVNIPLHSPEISLKKLLSIADIGELRNFFNNSQKINSNDLFEGFRHVLGNRCPSMESVSVLFKELGLLLLFYY